MDYRELEPPPALRGQVTFWRLSGARPADGVRPEPIVPDGCVELIVHLGDPFVLEQDGRLALQPRMLVAGPGSRPVRLAPTGASDVIGVRIAAGHARAFVDVPLAELADRLPAMDEVAPELARDLAEELAGARGAAWTEVLTSRLVRRLSRTPAVEELAARAAARLRASGGRIEVATLARDLGRSTRQVSRFARCSASSPSVQDFAWGRKDVLEAGTSARRVRVVASSLSSSGRRASRSATLAPDTCVMERRAG